MAEVTPEEMQEFVSKYTLLPIAPQSRLVKDLYFKQDDGRRLLNAFGLNFDVNMMSCQPQMHFASDLKMLSPIWLIIIPAAILLLLSSSSSVASTNLFFLILLLAGSIWVMAFLAFKNRDGRWRLPEIDLTVSELTRIANSRMWPKEIYRNKNV